MRWEDAILTERLAQTGGRGMRRYPDLHPGRPGAPLPPVTGYAAWWDASRVSSLTFHSGGPVSQMNDLSSSAFNMAQATLGNAPTAMVHTSLLNGRAALLFRSGLMYMSSSCPADDRTETAFVVGIAEGFTGNPTVLGCDGDGGRQIRMDTDGTLAVLKAGVSYILNSSLAVTAGTPFCVASVLDATSCELRLNGSSESASNSTTFTTGRLTALGRKGATDPQWFAGLIGEVLIYPTALASGDVTAVMAYLMAKWGI